MGGTVPPKIFPGPSAIGGSDGTNVVTPAQAVPGASALGSSVNTINRAPVLPKPPTPPAPPRPSPLVRPPSLGAPGSPVGRASQIAYGGSGLSRLQMPIRLRELY